MHFNLPEKFMLLTLRNGEMSYAPVYQSKSWLYGLAAASLLDLFKHEAAQWGPDGKLLLGTLKTQDAFLADLLSHARAQELHQAPSVEALMKQLSGFPKLKDRLLAQMAGKNVLAIKITKIFGLKLFDVLEVNTRVTEEMRSRLFDTVMFGHSHDPDMLMLAGLVWASKQTGRVFAKHTAMQRKELAEKMKEMATQQGLMQRLAPESNEGLAKRLAELEIDIEELARAIEAVAEALAESTDSGSSTDSDGGSDGGDGGDGGGDGGGD